MIRLDPLSLPFLHPHHKPPFHQPHFFHITRFSLTHLRHPPTLRRPPVFLPRSSGYVSSSSSSNEEEEEEEKEAKEAKEEEELSNEKKKKKKKKKLKLALIFGLWYLQNVIFNIYNKKSLNIFPYPWFLATFQLLVGSLWMSLLWSLRLYPFPAAAFSDRRFLVALLGPSFFHTVGHVSACVSFSKVAVSFTHVIKASEPAFSVAISSLLGTFYPLPVWLSVIPIVFGCTLAAVTELSFDLTGLWGALISNLAFVLRNISSKNSLHEYKNIDGLNLYGLISIISLIYLAPVAVIIEGSKWSAGVRNAVAALGAAQPWTFYTWVLISGVCYHLYNQTSYQALDEISPLTFSVGNTMKRVVVIVASVFIFRNPVRPLNALGSAVAVVGTFLYSQATAMAKTSSGSGGNGASSRVEEDKKE